MCVRNRVYDKRRICEDEKNIEYERAGYSKTPSCSVVFRVDVYTVFMLNYGVAHISQLYVSLQAYMEKKTRVRQVKGSYYS